MWIFVNSKSEESSRDIRPHGDPMDQLHRGSTSQSIDRTDHSVADYSSNIFTDVKQSRSLAGLTPYKFVFILTT